MRIRADPDPQHCSDTSGGGVLLRDSRKSIFLAGLSQVPAELDETRPFNPDVESTRLGE